MLREARRFRYEGDTNEFNQRHGIGRAFLRNGDVYMGNYHNGNRHGYGIYTCNNGAVYEGEWVNGKKHGQGKFTYPDGSTYDGQWEKDKRHGIGIYRYPNGDIYEGKWMDHLKNGFGKYTYAKADVQYLGTWTMGQRDEGGELLDSDLEPYIAQIKMKEIANNKNREMLTLSWNFPHYEPVSLPAMGKPAFPGGEGVVELSNRKFWWMSLANNAVEPPPYPGHEGETELSGRRAWWQTHSVFCK